MRIIYFSKYQSGLIPLHSVVSICRLKRIEPQHNHPHWCSLFAIFVLFSNRTAGHTKCGHYISPPFWINTFNITKQHVNFSNQCPIKVSITTRVSSLSLSKKIKSSNRFGGFRIRTGRDSSSIAGGSSLTSDVVSADCSNSLELTGSDECLSGVKYFFTCVTLRWYWALCGDSTITLFPSLPTTWRGTSSNLVDSLFSSFYFNSTSSPGSCSAALAFLCFSAYNFDFIFISASLSQAEGHKGLTLQYLIPLFSK